MLNGELRRQKALFAVADTLALVGAVEAPGLLRAPFGLWTPQRPLQEAEVVATTIVIAAVWIVTARAAGRYQVSRSSLKEVSAVIKASSAALLTFLILCFVAHQQPSRLAVGIAFLCNIGFATFLRILLRRCIRHVYASPAIAVPMVIVGCNPFALYVRDRIADELSQYDFLGFINENAPANSCKKNDVLGGLDQLPHLASAHPNLEAAVILNDSAHARTEEIIDLCEKHKVRWRVMPSQFRSLVRPLKVDMVGVIPLIGPCSSNIEGLNYITKRCFDVLAATVLLVLASPVLLLAALALWIFDGRPLLFRQMRVGIHGKRFELLKFRTMREQASDDVHREFVRAWIRQNGNATNGQNGSEIFKLRADPRITGVGRWLRKFSLDELPQFVNVLRGEMSLIGPRPALPYELELYQDWHRHRLDALPGITGLWQVSGRNRLPFDQMVRLDIQYIEDWSFTGDLRILLRTLPALFQGSGL